MISLRVLLEPICISKIDSSFSRGVWLRSLKTTLVWLSSIALRANSMMERPGRNDPCPCGSGRKYKKCCYRKDSEPRKIKASVMKKNPLAGLVQNAFNEIKPLSERSVSVVENQEASKTSSLTSRIKKGGV
jgi:hypothetical protein